jgi:hypothetical protein
MKIRFSTRLVIIFSKFVLKIPVDRRGYLQGKNEGRRWKQYGHTGMLGKLHWEFLGLVAMKRYDSVPISRKILPAHIKGMKMMIPEFDFPNCNLSNRNDWGYSNGGLVLIDYGINEYVSTLY